MEIIITIITVIGAIGTLPAYKGWFINVLDWNKKETHKSLSKQLAHLEALHTNPSQAIGWAMEGIFIILGLISVSFLSAFFLLAEDASKFTYIVFSLAGLFMYMVALHKAGIATRLKNFEKTKKRLEEKISKYET